MSLKTTIREWFKTGLKPTQTQFWSFFDAIRWNDETIPVADIDGIVEILNDKAESAVVANHLIDGDAHNTLFELKEDKSKKGQANGYVPLNNFTKILPLYLSIIDNLVTGGSDNLLSAEQGKLLQNQINSINTLLNSDNINLDTIQEIVNAIEDFENSIDTLLVNDLVTGGATKALTAEMGVELSARIAAVQDNLDIEVLSTASALSSKQDIENQIEVSASMTAQSSWHGKTVLFTAPVTIVIPAAGLPIGWNFEGVTMPSSNVTWGISSPKVWLFGTPAVTPEKKIFTVMKQKTNSNNILLLGL
jgi:hypothetical protein